MSMTESTRRTGPPARQISQESWVATFLHADGKLQITIIPGPVEVLAVKGNINFNSWPHLVMIAAMELDEGHSNLVFDLDGVKDITSGGLIALETVAQRAARCGGKVVLCRVGCQVAKILELSRDTQLEIFPGRAAAMDAYDLPIPKPLTERPSH